MTGMAEVVYEAGEFVRQETLAGATVEVLSDAGAMQTGVVKQFDAALACCLVRYATGGKEWLDLSKRGFKLLVEVRAESSVPWYADGGQLELYSPDDTFQGGAVICSYETNRVRLYSETRGAFDIDPTVTAHKVVLHGLHGGAQVPAGQCIEVYSSVLGAFRVGHLMKRAVKGALVPVRFQHATGLEWVDLSAQTFKLVRFPGERQLPVPVSPRPFTFPRLGVGTAVEVFDRGVYCKRTVLAAAAAPHVYEVRDTTTLAPSLLDVASATCKVRVQAGMDLILLSGYAVEVYIKAARRVDVGFVCGGDNALHMLHVRFDGSRADWLHVATTKLKIRLPNDAPPLRRGKSATEVLASPPRPSLLRRAMSLTRVLSRTPLALARRKSTSSSNNNQDPVTVAWKMQIDPTTHRTYYVHIPSGTNQWTPPPGVDPTTLEWLEPEPYEIEADVSPITIPVGALEAVRHSRRCAYDQG
ncbi:hypothetical protein ACHHYP_13845 [Achlya hypogyna]|uniref:WW domain-containing protein n=1 Tax=Achlya hypogyna TaxID=1202772 RepID=A0A1V9YEL8_ACHHY|nr:hypothetical protein ACHHYP_13845 [Achlya hypogyna]